VSRVYRVRIPPDLEHQLQDFCARWHVSTSVAIRLALRYLMGHEEAVLEALVPPEQEPITDPRSPEQIRNADQYLRTMESMDLEEVMRGILR
jgi:hypothetical protein